MRLSYICGDEDMLMKSSLSARVAKLISHTMKRILRLRTSVLLTVTVTVSLSVTLNVNVTLPPLGSPVTAIDSATVNQMISSTYRGVAD